MSWWTWGHTDIVKFHPPSQTWKVSTWAGSTSQAENQWSPQHWMCFLQFITPNPKQRVPKMWYVQKSQQYNKRGLLVMYELGVGTVSKVLDPLVWAWSTEVQQGCIQTLNSELEFWLVVASWDSYLMEPKKKAWPYIQIRRRGVTDKGRKCGDTNSKLIHLTLTFYELVVGFCALQI